MRHRHQAVRRNELKSCVRFNEKIIFVEVLVRIHSAINQVPRIAIRSLQLFVSGDCRAQCLFLFSLDGHTAVILQRLQFVATHLDAVLDTQYALLHGACRFVAGIFPCQKTAAQFRITQQPQWNGYVPLDFELRHRHQAVRRSRVPGNKDRITCSGPGLAPLQIVWGRGWLTALINPQERHIQAPAGEIEVIGIATECSDVEFGGEHKANVVVAFVLIYKVLTAVIKRDRLTFQFVAGILFAA